MRTTVVAALAWIVLVVLAVSVSVSVSVSVADDGFGLVGGVGAAAGCGPATLPRWDDSQPRGQPSGRAAMMPPLRATADTTTLTEARSRGFAALAPSKTLGRQRQFVGAGSATFVQVYSTRAVGPGDTLDDIIADGGIYLFEKPRQGPDTAEAALVVLGDKAAQISRIGPHKASFSHASPDSNGIRTYRIYWSDAKSDHMVMGDVADPVELIDLARSMVCDRARAGARAIRKVLARSPAAHVPQGSAVWRRRSSGTHPVMELVPTRGRVIDMSASQVARQRACHSRQRRPLRGRQGRGVPRSWGPGSVLAYAGRAEVVGKMHVSHES